ncbi:SAM-dependent methyltransferase [Casimicrobium huifangae]|uniref:SAM-dependent methyltransferase n=1 Tax=Casimicrobium huifangae TaxID=2591109 RepID=UPI003785186A
MPTQGTLYLVPNLLGVAAPTDVLPARTIAVARRLGHFVVETPKVARAFLKTLSPKRVIADVAIVPCDPEAAAIAQCTAWLKAGIDVGVVSDAGCPGMADPGAIFVALAHQLGAPVVPLVGPSSVLLGLMASGFDGQHFTFHGYLPSKPVERDRALQQLERQLAATGATQVFIETPYRNATMLEALARVLAAGTQLCVAQNLASAGQRIARAPASQWSTALRATFADKAPTLFLLGRTPA